MKINEVADPLQQNWNAFAILKPQNYGCYVVAVADGKGQVREKIARWTRVGFYNIEAKEREKNTVLFWKSL